MAHQVRLACFKNQHSHGNARYRHLIESGAKTTLCGRIPDRFYEPPDEWPMIAFQWETCQTCLATGKKRWGGDPAKAFPHHATRAAHEKATSDAEARRKAAEKP